MQKKPPDNVFKISFDSLHIAGITPEDFLHKDKIVLDGVFIKEPIIEVYRRPRSYNEAERKRDDTATLYQRLSKQFKTISVNAITVLRGALIHKYPLQKNKNKRFNDVSLYAKDLLIDSSIQYDRNRFLFAKEAELSCKDYITRTPDSMYLF